MSSRISARCWYFADVYEPDVSKVHPGQTISVTHHAVPVKRIEAKVTYISDSVDPQTRTVKVRAIVPNPKRMLKAEMFVNVSIAAPLEGSGYPSKFDPSREQRNFCFRRKNKGELRTSDDQIKAPISTVAPK